MSRGEVVPSMGVDVHVNARTGLSHQLFENNRRGLGSWVVVKLGDHSGGVNLFVRDLAVLTALGEAVERARQDLAAALGLLPNGEPCQFVDLLGSIEWNEHDHDRCLEQLVDEPVPYLPTPAARVLGPVA